MVYSESCQQGAVVPHTLTSHSGPSLGPEGPVGEHVCSRQIRSELPTWAGCDGLAEGMVSQDHLRARPGNKC